MPIYEDIENSIVTQLAPLVSASLDVVPLPENEAAYVKPNSKNRITVMYRNSKFGDSNNPVVSTGVVAQDEDVFIEVVIESRKLRGSSGVYALWDALKILLLGFTPFDCDRLRLVDFGIEPKEKKDQTWTYVGCFYCTRLEVEKEIENAYPLIKEINFDYEQLEQ